MNLPETEPKPPQVEISSFDLRYENCRLKSAEAERRLLASIIEHGIKDPLQGVDTGQKRILLNGFKRLRCATRLGITTVPYQSLGNDEMVGIIELLRLANARSLSILEQAKLIDELKSTFKMSHSEIAILLEKSRAWVSMRAGMIRQMSDVVIKKVFDGDFPIYSYMYTIRQFIRMNGVKKAEVDSFVQAVSGKSLSTRDIEILAHGYFKGSEAFRQQINSGDILWGLNRLKQTDVDMSNCTAIEQSMLRDLEITQKYLGRVTAKCTDPRYKTASFYAQAHLLAGGILRHLDSFSNTIRAFYDRCGQT